MVKKTNNSYRLPRDWWTAKSMLWWLYLLLFVGMYKLFGFIMADISAGAKYGLREIWSISITVLLSLGASLLLIWIIFRTLKKTTIKFASKGLLVNDKETIKWDDLIGYKKTDNSVTLIDYKDAPYYFYTGRNLNYYVVEDLNKFTKEIDTPEKPRTKFSKFVEWFVIILIILFFLYVTLHGY